MTAVTHQAAALAVGTVVDFTDTGQCATADIGAKFAAFNRAQLIVHRDAPEHGVAGQHRRRPTPLQVTIQSVVHRRRPVLIVAIDDQRPVPV